MNVEKLRRLQSQVRIGGKGTARRKKKVMHQTATTDDKKLQSSLKKLSVSTIPGIEEVNIIKDDLTVIHFNNPKAQASLSANTFAVTGHGETKKIVEMLPEILPQLGQETVVQLRMFANSMAGVKKPAGNMGGGDATASTSMLYSVVEEDDVPMLVSDFDEVAKMEAMKVGEAIATNNEQPAIECEQTQKSEKSEKSDEVKGETATVLPPLTEVKSNEMGNAVQPLEILNLNIKSSVESELQKEDENIIKTQEIIPEKENINKTEKQNLKNDVGKTKEKSQPKQEPSKHKVKSESKPQKSSKDSKKPDNIAPKASTIKAGENREVETPAKDSVGKDIADIELERPEQVTKISTKLEDNKDHLQKQIQQKQPQKSTKQEPKKKEKQRGPLVDNQEKITEQDLSSQQKAIPNPIEGDGQQVKIEPNQQQQQNNESPIKQKNKLPQQKQRNEDNQNIAGAGKEFKSSEPVPNSPKQGNKQHIIKTSKEGSADKSIEIKKKNNEAPSQDIERHLKEASPNLKKAETQTKSSQQAKEALIDKVDAKKGTAESPPKSTKQGDKNIQKSDPVDKENKEGITLKGQTEEVGKQKEENVHIENTNKDNVSTIESGQKVEIDKSSENVSIKTVALQSLESSEKMMQIVNEITKDLMKENLSKLPEETIKQSARPNLSSDQQEVTEIAVKSLLTEELLPKSSVEEIQLTKVNTDNQKVSGPLYKTSTEIIQDLDSNAELLNKESDAKSVIIKEQLPSVANEIVADISLSMDTIPLKVSENNELSMAVEKEISQEQMLPSQDVSTIESNPSGEQLAKQTLPPTIPSSTAQIPPNNNNDKFIVVDHKQPTMAEILQPQPPTMPPVAVLPLPDNSLVGEMKDIQLKTLNKEDVKELQLYSTVAVDGANLCQPQDQEAITPELSTPSTDNTSDQRQITREKSASMPISPKQKASPPKQTTNAKTSNETTKPSTTGDAQKATGDAKLKLVTKPQIGQQSPQQQTSKVKSKPTNSNKSTPTTPTTPTKMSPEKGTTDKQKPQISATKATSDTATKKTNSPQKQQQTDTSGKAKSTPGASGKPARPNISTTSGTKKANTPPATNKTNANTGVKQADISKKGTTPGITTVVEQPTALAETKSAPTIGTTTTTPSTSSPTIESTATSNKPYPSK